MGFFSNQKKFWISQVGIKAIGRTRSNISIIINAIFQNKIFQQGNYLYISIYLTKTRNNEIDYFFLHYQFPLDI